MYILCLAMSGPFVDSEHLSDNISDIIYMVFCDVTAYQPHDRVPHVNYSIVIAKG